MARSTSRLFPALCVGASISLLIAGCGVGDDRWTYENSDGLLVAAHHGTHTSTAGVGLGGELRLKNGCWTHHGTPVAWPRDARWLDDQHTAVTVAGRTFRDGTPLGDRAGGSVITLDRSAQEFAPDAPCLPATGTVKIVRFDEVG